MFSRLQWDCEVDLKISALGVTSRRPANVLPQEENRQCLRSQGLFSVCVSAHIFTVSHWKEIFLFVLISSFRLLLKLLFCEFLLNFCLRPSASFCVTQQQSGKSESSLWNKCSQGKLVPKDQSVTGQLGGELLPGRKLRSGDVLETLPDEDQAAAVAHSDAAEDLCFPGGAGVSPVQVLSHANSQEPEAAPVQFSPLSCC